MENIESKLEKEGDKFDYRIIGTVVLVILIIVAVGFFAIFRQGKKTSVDMKAEVKSAKNESTTQVDYQKKLEQAKAYFEYKNQDISEISSLEKDVMDSVTDENLIIQYAEKNKIKVKEAEVLRRYDLIVKGFNKKNNIASGDSAFLLKIKEMYGIDKNTYLEQVKNEILKEKVQMKVKMPIKDWLITQRSNK